MGRAGLRGKLRRLCLDLLNGDTESISRWISMSVILEVETCQRYQFGSHWQKGDV